MRWIVRSLLLLLLATAPRALAAPAQTGQAAKSADEDTLRAKALFTQGQREFNLGHYQEALPLFEQAYKVKPIPELLYNTGQCQRLLGNLEQARRLYQNFLYAVPDGPLSEAAEEKLREVEQALKAQADARTSPPTSLAAPQKSGVVAGSLDKAVQETVKPAGAPPKVTTQPSASPAPSIAIVPPTPPPSRSKAPHITGWTLVGASVVAAGAGTIFGFSAKSSAADWTDATTAATWQSAKSSAQSDATLANVSWIAAGVLAAAGIATLVFFDR
jgi:tetratricopeptide (TPR) repeat protein